MTYHRVYNKPIRHLSFRIGSDLNTFVTSTSIGRIDMSCAHAQWMDNGYCRFTKFYLQNSMDWPSAPAHTRCRIGLL